MRVILVTGPEQLEELARATRYPKVRQRIATSDAGRLVNELRAVAVQVKRFPRVVGSTDPDDNALLGLAVAANADFLVSGDKTGLLSLRRFKHAQIVTSRQLREKLGIA